MRKLIGVGSAIALACQLAMADDEAAMQQRIDELRRQVDALQTQLSKLSGQVEAMHHMPAAAPAEAETTSKVLVSGEGAVAFFNGDANSEFPNNEFRLDEAKVFVDAILTENVYGFAEINLEERESDDENVHVGELYVDFEEPFTALGRALNVRAGRFDIPFGEEYKHRDAIDNVLISRSASDLWGVDEGVQIYGQSGLLDYNLAVQNGGHPRLHDYNQDKAVVARVGFTPTKHWRFSASAMRTGDLDPQGDKLSELWVGNGFVRSLSTDTNADFHADVVEGDAAYAWSKGHARAAYGVLHYDDDSAEQNARDLYYGYVEAQQQLVRKLYTAARVSHMEADDGFPIVGWGNFGDYFFGELTDDLWRYSVGFGYRWSPNLVLKTEYTREKRNIWAAHRQEAEDLVALQLAYHFAP